MAPGLLQNGFVRKRRRTKERRSIDRPIKRLRQLQARLDVLLHESQALRSADAIDSLKWPVILEPDPVQRGGD